MTSTQFASLVRYNTRTNSTTFTDADILLLMEVRQYEIAGAILKADEDILLIPQVDSLEANQREYALPSDILVGISRVEIKLDGTNWLYIEEIDLTDIKDPTVTEANITSLFDNSEGNAFYDIKRKALYIYSGTITSVTDGLKVWINTYPSVITTLGGSTDMSVDPSTTTHGVPRVLHEIWARGVAIDYKESREKPIPLTEREQSYNNDLDEAIALLKMGNKDREIISQVPHGAEVWRDGFDL